MKFLSWPLKRARCVKGWHKLKEYEAVPYVAKRSKYRQLVVRAANGKCEVCHRTVNLHTPATPRWQRGNKTLHKIYLWLKGD